MNTEKPFTNSESEVNPYAPPASEAPIHEPPVIAQFHYEEASQLQRFLNFIIDRFAIMGFAMVVGLSIATLEETGLIQGWLASIENMSRLEDLLITAVLSVVYYTAFEGIFGITVGKLITGTKVFHVHGGKPTYLAILGRSFTRIIPFEPFSFLGKIGKRGWHDRWSDTMVLDVRNKKPVQGS